MNPEHAHHYGCLVEDSEHRLLHYAEKPETYVSDLINSGIYCFSPKIFDVIKDAVQRFEKQEDTLGTSTLYVLSPLSYNTAYANMEEEMMNEICCMKGGEKPLTYFLSLLFLYFYFYFINYMVSQPFSDLQRRI